MAKRRRKLLRYHIDRISRGRAREAPARSGLHDQSILFEANDHPQNTQTNTQYLLARPYCGST